MHGTCPKQAQSTRITYCRRQAPATAPNHTTLDYWISNSEKGSNSVVRITRGSEKVYEGPIASLKHFKDEVKEIKAGTECGMVFEKFNDIQPEDMIEAHIMVEVPR